MRQTTLLIAAGTLLSLSALSQAQDDGEAVYQQCSACHGAEGEGGAGPALAGNRNLENADYHISRILNGGAGMPAFRDQLSDEQIAAVATFERTSWGNDFSEVTAEQVAAQRSGQATQEDEAAQSEGGAEVVTGEAATTTEGDDTQASQTTSAQQAPLPKVDLQVVAEGLVSPVYLTSPEGDPRRFIVDRTGQIYIMNENDQLVEQPFLDISDRMVDLSEEYDERGFFSLAFHPNYADNGLFYVYYSAPLRESAPDNWNHTSHVSEFMVSEDNPNLADANSERVLLEIDQPQMNHNGGGLAFSPEDGYLYVSVGDGGAADDVAVGHPPIGNGQDITSVLGDILRIDVDRGYPGYAIPQDNPFVNREGADEIYAWGWRNPWRMSFDRGGNHDLFVTSNGQNLWEAVYVVDAPANYGWNILEGTHCFSTQEPNVSPEECNRVGPNGEALELPIIEYPHLANQGDSPIAGSSVTGGYVYRGSAIPELVGQYVFGDWSSAFDAPKGQLFVANPDAAGGLWAIQRLADLELFVLGFGEDADGEIYVMTTENAGPAGDTGKVHKLVTAQ